MAVSTEPSHGTPTCAGNSGGSAAVMPAPPPAAAEKTHTKTTLRYNPGLSTNWTLSEQSTLEDLLVKYASDPYIVRCRKIAQQLKRKTIRDVAMRCRWMTLKLQAFGGEAGQLLVQNSQAFNQISSNFAALEISGNIYLFCQTRDNILKLLINLNGNDAPEMIRRLSPLPVKVNEELANSILSQSHIKRNHDNDDQTPKHNEYQS